MFDTSAHPTGCTSQEQLDPWRVVSIHESAHAVAAIALGKPAALINVFLDQSGIVRGYFFGGAPAPMDEQRLPDRDGFSSFCASIKSIVNVGSGPLDPPQSMLDEIVIRLAAVVILLPIDKQLAVRCGAGDIESAIDLARALASPAHPVNDLLNSALWRAAEICDRHLRQVLALGDHLAKRHRMDREEIMGTLAAEGFPASTFGPPDPKDFVRWPASFAARRMRIQWATERP